MQRPVILDNGNRSPATSQATSPLSKPTLESQLHVRGGAHVHELLCSTKPSFQRFGAKKVNFLPSSTPHFSQRHHHLGK